MNEREREFFRRLSALKLSGNDSRMVYGLLSGLSVRECGMPPTSAERCITRLRAAGVIEKVKGRWQLAGDVAGLFDVPKLTTPVATPAPGPAPVVPAPEVPKSPENPPPAANGGGIAPPEVVNSGVKIPPGPAFFRRKGGQQAQVIARLQLSGYTSTQKLTDACLAARHGPVEVDADLAGLLERAEKMALAIYGPPS